MTNQKLINLFQDLKEIKDLKGAKFNYALAKNINILTSEIESLYKGLEQTEDFKKFEQERVELCKKHAKKEENGEAVLKNNQFVIENQADFDKEFEALKETNKETVEARDNQVKDFEKLLKEENTIELFKIPVKDIPEEITTVQMQAIFPIVE